MNMFTLIEVIWIT